MLIPKEAARGTGDEVVQRLFRGGCSRCRAPAEIVMLDYAEENSRILLCRRDALQLARKLLEDLFPQWRGRPDALPGADGGSGTVARRGDD